jgi:outer membrane protein OmpA-like peptidoglycan-associated protein
MAEIEIKPKEKGGFNWMWLLAIAALAGLVIWLVTRNKDTENTVADAGNKVENTAAGAAGAVKEAGEDVAAEARDAWESVDLNAPKVERPELKIKSADFETRGNDNYTVYSLGENLLFDTDKAELRADAQENLKQVVASINQRYANGNIRLYGFTDATAGKEYNKELSEKRAENVKNWLTQNGMDASRISVHPMGEAKPEASNQTEAGRQQNRRVEIVAMNSQNNQSGQ